MAQPGIDADSGRPAAIADRGGKAGRVTRIDSPVVIASQEQHGRRVAIDMVDRLGVRALVFRTEDDFQRRIPQGRKS